MDSTQEQQLIHKARANPQHFRELYRAYLPKVYAYVAYRLPQTADAEDVVSDVFLKALKNLKQYKGASFAAWLFSIARNAVHDFYRQHGYAPIDDLEDETPDETPPLDSSVIADESRDEMLRLIGTLSPRRQEVITLKFFGGLQNYEIATVLNLDERSVASHLCRALRDLHERYLTERKISHERS